MTRGFIELSEYFPAGTIGSTMDYVPESGYFFYYLNENLFSEDSEDFLLMPLEKLERFDRAVLNLEFDLEIEEPDSDEVLRQKGFYDSNDPRNCMNRKRWR